MWKEFKEFAMRGNVLDMAVGVIIGGAFGKIVTSLVNDILMPPIGLLVSQVDFAKVCFSLQGHRFTTLDAAKAAGATTLNIGVFINTFIDFIIMAFVIFLLVQFVQRIKQRAFPQTPAPSPAPSPAPTTKSCPFCCSKIPLGAVRCPNCTSALAPAPGVA
ncbi:MAG: large conductance mechanosensitive channel protein MscL [Verrucomicrobia bacterium]|nr:large conductance mechanosensitive channel protein MscL [Verrucomicrobiota bacterium]MCG2678366.1 large conductance mechanosensitive channel protein MscL [Kiritimatiellia bacterium]MBU4247347.1 large conductance mechanosensitive channel protein MscL [Verrucomicrobiota bacterium]MBU4291472.1 large conductance mechanosensitive channel protein MscL [Verrucomicrobiota bacterium]MBU4428736.1 large conductance mechanosensitive channel protein MscL [Verrucomicrobiota bacterium]